MKRMWLNSMLCLLALKTLHMNTECLNFFLPSQMVYSYKIDVNLFRLSIKSAAVETVFGRFIDCSVIALTTNKGRTRFNPNVWTLWISLTIDLRFWKSLFIDFGNMAWWTWRRMFQLFKINSLYQGDQVKDSNPFSYPFSHSWIMIPYSLLRESR